GRLSNRVSDDLIGEASSDELNDFVVRHLRSVRRLRPSQSNGRPIIRIGYSDRSPPIVVGVGWRLDNRQASLAQCRNIITGLCIACPIALGNSDFHSDEDEVLVVGVHLKTALGSTECIA